MALELVSIGRVVRTAYQTLCAPGACARKSVTDLPGLQVLTFAVTSNRRTWFCSEDLPAVPTFAPYVRRLLLIWAGYARNYSSPGSARVIPAHEVVRIMYIMLNQALIQEK